jgi:hypothetical protein
MGLFQDEKGEERRRNRQIRAKEEQFNGDTSIDG